MVIASYDFNRSTKPRARDCRALHAQHGLTLWGTQPGAPRRYICRLEEGPGARAAKALIGKNGRGREIAPLRAASHARLQDAHTTGNVVC
jgi:hypothetical protein